MEILCRNICNAHIVIPKLIADAFSSSRVEERRLRIARCFAGNATEEKVVSNGFYYKHPSP